MQVGISPLQISSRLIELLRAEFGVRSSWGIWWVAREGQVHGCGRRRVQGGNTWVTARAMLLKNMPEASVYPTPENELGKEAETESLRQLDEGCHLGMIVGRRL